MSVASSLYSESAQESIREGCEHIKSDIPYYGALLRHVYMMIKPHLVVARKTRQPNTIDDLPDDKFSEHKVFVDEALSAVSQFCHLPINDAVEAWLEARNEGSRAKGWSYGPDDPTNMTSPFIGTTKEVPYWYSSMHSSAFIAVAESVGLYWSRVLEARQRSSIATPPSGEVH